MNAHARVLDLCSTYDHQSAWKEIRKVSETRLFSAKPPVTRIGKPITDSSCTFVCLGKLGSGKSVLMANIVDDLHLHAESVKHPVAYFFCRYDSSESLNPRTVIGSLARQLLRRISDLTTVQDLVEKTTLVLDSEEILCILRRALPPQFRAYFVLDGLDECDDRQRGALTSYLRKLQDIFALDICVSYRLEAGNVLRLSPGSICQTIYRYNP